MTDEEKIVALIASVRGTYTSPRPIEPQHVLLIGRGAGSFDHVIGTDGKALKG